MPAYEIEDLNSAVKRVLAGDSARSVSDSTPIPYRTLTIWVAKGKMGIFRAPVRHGPDPLLSQPAEACLVEWIVGRQLVGHPASRKEIIFKAGTMSSMATGQTARNAVTKSDLEQVFSSLIKAVVENRLDASRVFNMDETAFQTNNGSKRVVAVRGSKNVWHQDVALNFHLTLVACGSASGCMVPHFVLPGLTVKLEGLDGCAIPGAAVTTSSSGFMNGFLFLEWQRFFSASVPKDVQRPLLLILDGCSSHYSVEIILEAARVGVLLLLLPSNATHLLQPLDVAVFSSFKAKLRRLTEIYVGETGRNSVDKEEAIRMASAAWVGCKMGETVQAGFAGCVLFPPSKPRMDMCIDNFRRNGTPASTKLAVWLRIKEVVQKEMLVLPPSKKRVHKTATVAGRLLTKETHGAMAQPVSKLKKAARTKKDPMATKATKTKRVLSPVPEPVQLQFQSASKHGEANQQEQVVWEAIV
ncbi:hypothetical protein PHYSODRAFT_261985 [Phytophthora sojae]|uniref:DDE-1 domain-containing protein n=1 Tax=Phytophthora sojae (strain P6497) TaxID=1094619 RepID=G5AGD4_PHYSP|nr:hypothetical protein PHYSODRAFT_261985 [Phytophthora sojae]EGZ05374.1 hypothetical protein PHYSODRAFT_261985 [Phytophthora sojae]|eukprot:XP_009538905.1 hypothetical protein PHYSODRAFT_261985 [Phytophthora sojae]